MAARQVAGLPPTGAIFAAFLGYNPMATLLPGKIVDALSPWHRAFILGKEFFPNWISPPFKSGLGNGLLDLRGPVGHGGAGLAHAWQTRRLH